MNYRTLIAFMGKKHLDKYRPSASCELLTDKARNWDALVSAHPDIWELDTSGRLKRIDGGGIPWLQMSRINRSGKNGVFLFTRLLPDLGRESNPYIYHVSTGSIVFNTLGLPNDKLGLPNDKFEELMPKIDEALNSNPLQEASYIEIN